MIASFCTGSEVSDRLFRRTLVRYLMLAEVIVFRSISTAVKKRFPTEDHVRDAGKHSYSS